MPISVPAALIPTCYADGEHFKNVIEHLFVPAVKDAGYDPILPITTGGEIIIAEIIHHLAKADMVLCDISAHNPNVFYELGIRTALDKPVALVRDSSTTKIPFDTAAINIEEYPSDLRPWNMIGAKAKIAAHVKASAKKAGGRNAAWRYFGVTEHAEFAPQKSTQQDKLDVILARLDRIESPQAEISKPRRSGRLFNTVQDYLLHGEAETMIGQLINIRGDIAEIRSVDLRNMLMSVKVGNEMHKCNLKHPETLAMNVSPF